MTVEREFRIVDDALRETTHPTGAGRRPEYDAIADGKTVFFPLNGEPAQVLGNRIRGAVNKRGKACTARAVTIDDEAGLLVWTTGEWAGKS